MYMEITAAALIGYLLGSVPFALIIGKVFYKTDIRKFGSGNLGGGNAGRVLGKKAGAAVMTLDILKVTLAIFITSHFPHSESMTVVSGLAAAAGHCYPLFAGFRGGKAVAVMYGFLLGMALFAGCSPWIFFFPLTVFLIVLYLWKIVALASICSAVFASIFICFTAEPGRVFYASLVFAVVIIWRHRKNIGRMIEGNENKISWM